jgi:ribulose bisphosphate carboxylase small subunit
LGNVEGVVIERINDTRFIYSTKLTDVQINERIEQLERQGFEVTEYYYPKKWEPGMSLVYFVELTRRRKRK